MKRCNIQYYMISHNYMLMVHRIHSIDDAVVPGNLLPCLSESFEIANIESLKLALLERPLTFFVQIIPQDQVGMRIYEGSEAADLLPFLLECHISPHLLVYECDQSQGCSPGKAKEDGNHCRVEHQGYQNQGIWLLLLV